MTLASSPEVLQALCMALSVLLSGRSVLLSGLRVLLQPTHVQKPSAGLRHVGRQAYSHANKASEGPKLQSHLRADALTIGRCHCRCVMLLLSD